MNEIMERVRKKIISCVLVLTVAAGGFPASLAAGNAPPSRLSLFPLSAVTVAAVSGELDAVRSGADSAMSGVIENACLLTAFAENKGSPRGNGERDPRTTDPLAFCTPCRVFSLTAFASEANKSFLNDESSPPRCGMHEAFSPGICHLLFLYFFLFRRRKYCRFLARSDIASAAVTRMPDLTPSVRPMGFFLCRQGACI